MKKAFPLLLPKGMRDLSQQESLLQNFVLDHVREVFERYGYLPLDTPVVERMDILKAKFAVGEGTDVSKEIFQVADQGGRDLGLRFDMTVPLARYVAMNPTLKMPFKRYAIGKVFRDGPIKLGRYREFWQADADVVGIEGPLADAEGIFMAHELFSQLGLDVTLHCSSRELLHELMEEISIPKPLRQKVIIALDKLKRIGEEGVLKEMKDHGIAFDLAKKLLSTTSLEGGNGEKIIMLKKELPKSRALARLESIFELIKDLPNVVFDPQLARGLAYYTGFFFECYLRKSAITSSLVGTGRYDKMIGQFLGGKHEFPAVGISFGVSVICDALKEKNLFQKQSLCECYVVPVSVNEIPYALSVTNLLRKAGFKTDMDMTGRSIGKNFSYANSFEIPFVIVVGEEEQKNKTCAIKEMATGKQENVLLSEIVSFFQKRLR